MWGRPALVGDTRDNIVFSDTNHGARWRRSSLAGPARGALFRGGDDSCIRMFVACRNLGTECMCVYGSAAHRAGCCIMISCALVSFPPAAAAVGRLVIHSRSIRLPLWLCCCLGWCWRVMSLFVGGLFGTRLSGCQLVNSPVRCKRKHMCTFLSGIESL